MIKLSVRIPLRFFTILVRRLGRIDGFAANAAFMPGPLVVVKERRSALQRRELDHVGRNHAGHHGSRW
ncbi:hypothetical protein CDG81_02045 [Actinopolyspora erythraea]|uniref:Uncharacterized protein n=1 Tax=Actinopolyspora erythraea TaxID=414996 RepID=A0A099D2N5_9ACTN|nr:hypothetical protein CDG81_02045 [Actinopolyspora erythraea]KGI80221.1 hypothetical protein IL38_18940 [Actinopolyspora erythraea]